MDDLHLYELAEQGVLITPNPDDPAMIPQGDLAYVLYHLGKRYGDPFVEHLRGNSIRAAFGLTAEQKQHYLRLNRLS